MSIAEARDFEVVGEERATPYARQFEATHPDYPGPILVEILGSAPKSGPELATLAEQLLTPADLRATGVSRSFGVSAAVSAVIERALGDPGFASVRDLVGALSDATSAEDRPMRVTDSALVRVETALMETP